MLSPQTKRILSALVIIAVSLAVWRWQASSSTRNNLRLIESETPDTLKKLALDQLMTTDINSEARLKALSKAREWIHSDNKTLKIAAIEALASSSALDGDKQASGKNTLDAEKLSSNWDLLIEELAQSAPTEPQNAASDIQIKLIEALTGPTHLAPTLKHFNDDSSFLKSLAPVAQVTLLNSLAQKSSDPALKLRLSDQIATLLQSENFAVARLALSALSSLEPNSSRIFKSANQILSNPTATNTDLTVEALRAFAASPNAHQYSEKWMAVWKDPSGRLSYSALQMIEHYCPKNWEPLLEEAAKSTKNTLAAQLAQSKLEFIRQHSMCR